MKQECLKAAVPKNPSSKLHLQAGWLLIAQSAIPFPAEGSGAKKAL